MTADDFGLGPATSRGILELAGVGVVTSTVLLVTSPFAVDGVRQWRAAGARLELGWHPCLTLDAPVLPGRRVPTLVDAAGRFRPLDAFLTRLAAGRVDGGEVTAEFAAQLARFRELTGRDPANVNAHHHLHIFGPVGRALARVLAGARLTPFVRRVVESARTLRRVPGARPKRLGLTLLGRAAARRQARCGLPGAQTLLGVGADDCFPRWLEASAGDCAELVCHPGHYDATIGDRDGPPGAPRRARELERLARPEFREAVRRAGYTLTPAGGRPAALAMNEVRPARRAASPSVTPGV